MKIGHINIEHPIFLAPMAGVTDMPYRIICKKLGASVVYTEFVSADGIIRESIKTLNMIKFTPEERPVGVQIFGDNSDVVSKSALMVYEKFKPDLIDINFGCPVPKITKKGAGSAALKDLSLMSEIVSKVIEKVPQIPITVKMRSGWNANNIVAIEAGKMLEELGVKAITLHARTAKQSYAGYSDWDLIKNLKESINIPVIGNGDVNNVESYHKIKEVTKCDGVMIGRGALGNPWIFKQIKDSILKNEYFTPDMDEVLRICMNHIKLLIQYKSPIASINLSKKHLNYYLKNFKNASLWRKKIMSCSNTNQIINILQDMKKEY